MPYPGTRWHSSHPTSITAEGRALLRPVIEALIEARRAKGLRQEDVDIRIGCADRLISKFECGIKHPSLNMIAVWCEVLGVALSIQPTGSSPAFVTGIPQLNVVVPPATRKSRASSVCSRTLFAITSAIGISEPGCVCVTIM